MAETDTIQDTEVDSPPQTPPQTPTPQQPPDKVRALYDAVSHDYDLGDFNTFKQKLQDPEKQKAFYNGVGKDYDLGTFDDFSKKVSGNRPPSGFSETSGIGLDNERQKAIQNAPIKLQNIISSPAYAKAAESLNAEQYGKQLRDAGEKYQNGDITKDQYDKMQSDLVTAGFNAKNQIGQTVESSKNNEQLMTKLLIKTIDQNKDKNPKLATDIKSTAQLLQQKDLDPQKVWDLNKKINSNQVDYDLNMKRPTYDPGIAGNFMLELKNHLKAGDKADFLSTAPKDQIIAEEEKSRQDGAKNDPFTPVPKGQGWSSVSGTVGANAIPMAEGFGASAAVGGAEFLSGGSVTPLLAPALGGLFMARDASKQALTSTFEQVYHEQRNNGATPDQAYETAMQQGKFNSVASAAQMAAMSFVGLKTANKPLFGGIWGKPFKQFITESAPKVLPSLQKIIPEVAGQATLAGMTKAAENINAGKPVGTDVGNEMAGTASFLGALHLLGTAREVLTKRGNTVAMNGMANANPDFVEKGIDQLVAQKDLTTEQAEDLKNKLAEQRSLNKDLPENVPEENKQKIKDLIDKRTQLENQLDPEHPDFVDKAYHPDIKEQINGVKKEKADGTTEGKDGINEKIRQLSEPVKSDADEPLLKSPMGQAKEIISERSKNGMLGGYPSDDPEALLKHIAEQAHGGSMLDDKFISTRQPTEDAFGKDLTDLATKIHPEHIIQEPKAEPETATGEPSYLLSRHADTIKDEEGKVSGPNEHPLSPHGRKDANDLANEVEQHVKDTGVPVTKIIHSSLERAKETGDKVAAKTGAKTVSDKALDTWDIGQFDDVKDEDFKKVQKYFVEHPDELEYEGKKLGETFNQYAHRTIDAHAKYQNEPASTMLIDHSNNMMIMDAYRKNGNVWDGKAAHDYLNTEKPEPATLVNNKNKQNAVREQTASEVRLRDETAVGAEMGGRNTEHQEPTGQVNEQPNTEEKGKTEGEKEPRVSGIAQRVQEQLGLKPYEAGKGWSKEDSFAFGKAAIDHGIDPEKAVTDKNYADLEFHERIAVAQAYDNQLTKEMYQAGDKFGEDSKQYKEAEKAVIDFQNSFQHLKTQSSQAFTAQQGEIDVDTGSFVSIKNAVKEKLGRPLTSGEESKVKELTGKVSDLTNKVSDLEQKLTEATDKNLGAGKEKATYKEKAKAYADAFRKLKTQPFTFKDSNGNSIEVTKMGTGWNDIVELGAKAIEKTGEIADGIAAVVEKIKDADWYKGLSNDDKNKFATELQSHYEENAPEIALTPEEKNIKRLEKQLKDLQQGNAKQHGPKRELSKKEKELQENIYEAKKNLGLIKSKEIKEPKSDLEDYTKLAEQFIDKKGNKFTPEEAKSIWQYGKTNYLNNGIGFRDMIVDVSRDTGLTFDQVSHAIVTPETKSISDAMWKQRYTLEKNKLSTKRYVDSQGKNSAIKKFNNVVNIFREESVFGHGGIFVGTHSGMTLMDLPRMKHTVEAFFNAYKLAYGKTADYEQAMEGLKNSKNYVLAQRSGLQNNPDIINNDSEVISSKLGKLSDTGKRGFNAIKILRQAVFDSHYNALSDIEKADPSSAVGIAELINNATGATNLPLPPWFKEVTFAGGMEAARWGKLTKNPLKATSIALKALFDPKNTPVGDKVFAKVWASRVGWELATFAGVLGLNAAIQNRTNGGKKNVNLTDPTKSDWLKMKFGNTTFDFTSGMLSTLNFAKSMIYQPISNSKANVIDKEAETVFKYGMGKLSPFYSKTGEALLKHDYSGNTVPWSDAKPLHSYNHKMTWQEYGESYLPLPVAEGFNAFYESAQQNGMSKPKIDNVLNGLMYGAISGTTGFRAYETTEPKKKSNNITP